MRIDQLTFTRFIAAFAVVLFHFSDGIFPFNTPILLPIVTNSNVFVSYFFMISGFVMVIAYHKSPKINVRQYYLSRLFRIFPAFLLSLLLTLAYFIWIGKEINGYSLALQVVLIQAWIKNQQLTFNFPSWSLSVEVFFYLLFPFLFNYLYKTKNTTQFYITIILFWFLSQTVFLYLLYTHSFDKQINYILYLPLFHLNEFLAGNLLGFFIIKKSPLKSNTDFVIIILSLIIILSMYFISPYKIFHNGLLAPIFGLLIFFIAVNNGMLTNVFTNSILILLGEISYGIYIYQFPVFKISNFIFFKVLKLSEYYQSVFYINCFLLIIVSYTSYRLIENPIVIFIKNKIKGKPDSSI